MSTHGVFWLFSAIIFLFVFFIIFCVPETQGLSLEDIERLYSGRQQARDYIPPSSGAIQTRRMSSIANLKATPSIIL